jgi:hypothetical protein
MAGTSESPMAVSSTTALHAVIYVSRFTALRHATIDACVADILRSSLPNNQRSHVTGALLACDGWFLQALEGRRIDVEHTLRRIERDPNHHGIRRIAAGPIAERRFGAWKMCAGILSPTDQAIVRTLAGSGKFAPRTLTAASALNLLHAVARLQSQPG